MTEVFSGEDVRNGLRQNWRMWGGVALGLREYWLPLNGGSQTRRDVREDMKFLADSMGLIFEGCAYCVKIRGPSRFLKNHEITSGGME